MTPSSRHRFLTRLTHPAWEVAIGYDLGAQDLGDPSAPLLALLPRVAEAPELDGLRVHFRLRVSRLAKLRLGKPHALLLRRLQTTPQWEQVELGALVPLEAPDGTPFFTIPLALALRIALHRQRPILWWQAVLHNPLPRPVLIQAYTPLSIGPRQAQRRSNRLDLTPTRWRLFRLNRPPQPQRHLFNLSARVGSLRLLPNPTPLRSYWANHLNPSQATLVPLPPSAGNPIHQIIHPADAEPIPALAPALEHLRHSFAPSAPFSLGLLGTPDHRTGLAFLLSGNAPPWQVNLDPAAPGLHYTLSPQHTLLPGSTWASPPTALLWLHPTSPLTTLFHHLNMP